MNITGKNVSLCRNNEWKMTSKQKTWSLGTISRLPFAVCRKRDSISLYLLSLRNHTNVILYLNNGILGFAFCLLLPKDSIEGDTAKDGADAEEDGEGD